MKNTASRNKYFFGLGTVGRDMFYAFEANALLFFLSDVLKLPVATFAAVSMVLTVLRIFDAVNDPITGLVIDNIRSPWGKFKPAIAVGGVLSAVFFLILYGNVGTGTAYVIIFAIAYVLWDITYGINDIAYWTLLPALTADQQQREKYGAFARICANIGMYIVMVGWQPITAAMGNTPKSWFILACGICVLYLGFLCFPIFGVKEPKTAQREESTSLKQMWTALVGNDQLMWTTLSMALFTVGYVTTTGYAIYYMKYLFGDVNMYAVLAAVCGVAQLAALIVFPAVSKHFNRRQMYAISTVIVIVGYLMFFFAEHSLILIAVAAVVVFVGQAFIQLMMLMFLADTVEYGQWKLGKRNESVTFSIQPLINKLGGALSTGFISISIILAGIKTDSAGAEAASIDSAGKLIVKVTMFVIPLVMIVAGYFIYCAKYRLSEDFYGRIVSELKEKGELSEEM